MGEKPEWNLEQHQVVVAPTTNNQAEASVKEIRLDAGGVVGSVAYTLQFMLKQVQFESDRPFNPDELRQPAPMQ